jgi:hypothetical protein
MTESASPISREPARRFVDGTRSKWGVVLLYPDKLASVNVRAELWGGFLGPIVLIAAAWPVTEVLGAMNALLGVLIGSTIGRLLDKRAAVRKMAAGGGGATIIPLGSIDSLRTDRSTRLGGMVAIETLVVTTADGTEYGFRGRTAYLQAGVASALAELGREVRATPLGLRVARASIHP